VVMEPNEPVHTDAPNGAYLNSGWQYQGTWGSYLGTPISEHYFITAGHVGGSIGGTFTFQGVNYTTVAQYDDPQSDLRLWQVSGTFPSYASLYTRQDEVSRELVVFGRGALRGSEVLVGSTLHGWRWGNSGYQQRWGVNQVSSIYDAGAGLGNLLAADFNAGAGPNEAHLSTGDSGGGVFIMDAGVWKLAGINYAVDGPFSLTGGSDPGFNAMLFDAGGLYYKNSANAWTYLPDQSTDIPSSFYATRISSNLQWIDTVVPEPQWSAFTSVLCIALASIWNHRRRSTPSNANPDRRGINRTPL